MSRQRYVRPVIPHEGDGTPGAFDERRRRRFETIFEEVYEPLQRYVRRRTGGGAPVDADDVVADALLVVWRRLDDVPEDATLPWTYSVARRCLANHRRGAQRSDRLAARVAATSAGPADDVAVDGDPELPAALAELGDDDRELLRLWAWEQLTAGEIATVLGISANAASIRLHRARRRLAGRLGLSRKPTAPVGHTSNEHVEEDSG